MGWGSFNTLQDLGAPLPLFPSPRGYVSLRLCLSNLSKWISFLPSQYLSLSQAARPLHFQESQRLFPPPILFPLPQLLLPPPTPVSPAHSFPKPPSIHLENLGGGKHQTQKEHPQNGEPRKVAMMGEIGGTKADAICTLLLPASHSGGQCTQSLIFQRTGTSRAKEQTCLCPACAWH